MNCPAPWCCSNISATAVSGLRTSSDQAPQQTVHRVLWDRPAGVRDEVAGHVELVGPDGIARVHEVGGGAAVTEYPPQMIGLVLEEGCLLRCRSISFKLRRRVHCRRRRRCQRRGTQRPLTDQRSGGSCRCSARWMPARRALPRVCYRACVGGDRLSVRNLDTACYLARDRSGDVRSAAFGGPCGMLR